MIGAERPVFPDGLVSGQISSAASGLAATNKCLAPSNKSARGTGRLKKRMRSGSSVAALMQHNRRAIAILALTAASPALAQKLPPGPNIINGRPVTIGSNGRSLDDGAQTSCGYGQALFSLIETTASRLDPKNFPNQDKAHNGEHRPRNS